MKKESKNLGVRRACDNAAICKNYSIIRNMNLTGVGSFHTTCEKCGKNNKVIVGSQTYVVVKLAVAFMLMVLLASLGILYISKIVPQLTTEQNR